MSFDVGIMTSCRMMISLPSSSARDMMMSASFAFQITCGTREKLGEILNHAVHTFYNFKSSLELEEARRGYTFVIDNFLFINT